MFRNNRFSRTRLGMLSSHLSAAVTKHGDSNVLPLTDLKTVSGLSAITAHHRAVIFGVSQPIPVLN